MAVVPAEEAVAWCKTGHCETVGMGQWAWVGFLLEEFERKKMPDGIDDYRRAKILFID